MPLNSLTAQEKHDDSMNISGKTQDTLNWSVTDIEAVLGAPFNDLLFRAQSVHRQYHDANGVQLSTLISVTTTFIL